MAEALNRQLIGKQRGKQRGDGFESRLISIKKEKKEKSAAWIWEGLGRGEGGKKALGRVWEAGVGTPARGRAKWRAGRGGQAGGG